MSDRPPGLVLRYCDRCGVPGPEWTEDAGTATEASMREEERIQRCCDRHPFELCRRCRKVIHFDALRYVRS